MLTAPLLSLPCTISGPSSSNTTIATVCARPAKKWPPYPGASIHRTHQVTISRQRRLARRPILRPSPVAIPSTPIRGRKTAFAYSVPACLKESGSRPQRWSFVICSYLLSYQLSFCLSLRVVFTTNKCNCVSLHGLFGVLGTFVYFPFTFVYKKTQGQPGWANGLTGVWMSSVLATFLRLNFPYDPSFTTVFFF